MSDVVNKPAHYTYSKVEVIDALDAWNLPYKLAHVVRYVARAGRKDDALTDLKKAQWYLAREIAQREGKAPGEKTVTGFWVTGYWEPGHATARDNGCNEGGWAYLKNPTDTYRQHYVFPASDVVKEKSFSYVIRSGAKAL